MPNWCSNTMTIAAKDKESLEKMYQKGYRDAEKLMAWYK